jgi:effector-binding domain-containing protein
MACVVQHGSFAGFQRAYQALMNWIEANGYQITGPNREIYHQYERDGNPDDYVTEIQFPVAKA